ncbi:MAG: DEAD/DEAH box helicase, partial [Anaerolineae bacterium]|nr:DEAD/DEAH box helicase [Anaerolineae bacterium]
MSLDPIQTTQAITESYLNYLSTTFRLRDVELQRQFDEALRIPGKFVKGPILEATPPFETKSTIEALIREGVLSPRFRALRSEKLPLDRPLYQHQEEAIRKAVLYNRNIVVATGTGSGKTEAFLVPILNHLFQEDVSGGLGPGVRALLLYPMNALANDQMGRMRDLLKNCPRITFGRYTGKTERREKEAVKRYRKMFQRNPYPNELVSREQMWKAPPHILLTNYAMLEYLLLRPDDHVFFDGEYARHWRFLVIDEAHTYTGAKGIEMAMLLRRLKDRVVEGVGRL